MRRLTDLKQPEKAAKGPKDYRFPEPKRQPENQTRQPGRCFPADIVDKIKKNVIAMKKDEKLKQAVAKPDSKTPPRHFPGPTVKMYPIFRRSRMLEKNRNRAKFTRNRETRTLTGGPMQPNTKPRRFLKEQG